MPRETLTVLRGTQSDLKPMTSFLPQQRNLQSSLYDGFSRVKMFLFKRKIKAAPRWHKHTKQDWLLCSMFYSPRSGCNERSKSSLAAKTTAVESAPPRRVPRRPTPVPTLLAHYIDPSLPPCSLFTCISKVFLPFCLCTSTEFVRPRPVSSGVAA